MTNNEKEKEALFRFRVISPLISGLTIEKSISKAIENLASRKYMYNDKEISLSKTTIERWFYRYRKYGFDGLKPLGRNDCGKSRKLDSEVIQYIEHYVKERPRMGAVAIYDALINSNIIKMSDISVTTVYRCVKELKEKSCNVSKKELLRYEAEHVNDIWCADTTYSFKINVNGEKKRIFIIAIIDDCSRCIVGADVFFEDNYVNFMSVFKSAVSGFGRPKLLNVDNGAPYRNNQISLLCAKIGTTLYHDAAYSGYQKGKIERWFRTMKDHFMAPYTILRDTTIDTFRKDFLDYVYRYNNEIHSITKISPFCKYFYSDDIRIMLSQETIDKAFLLEIDRKVSIDNVIQINNKDYEVPYEFSNKHIKLRYSPDFKYVYVVAPDGSLKEIQLLDKTANSKIKREKPMFNVEES